MELQLSLLGPFGASVDGRALTHFRAKTAQALLIYLTCQPEGHGREHLMTLLWPGMPQPSAQQNLRQSLYLLRQAIPEIPAKTGNGRVPLVLADRQTVQMNPDGRYDLDVHAFTRLLQQDESHWPEAVALYRGDFLADFYLPDSAPFEEWANARRAELRQRCLDALATLTDHALQAANVAEAVRYARRQVELDNLRESAYRQLMTALAVSGQRSEALAQYETCRRLLRDELGVEPSTPTLALYERIARGELAEDTAVPTEQGTTGPLSIIERPLHNLPLRLSSFIGREKELAEVQELLHSNARLISLVGPGGIGKTRLALELAWELASNFAHGTAFANLAPLRSAESLVPALAQALYFKPTGGVGERRDAQQQLLDYLRDKTVLLVLDNFEHLQAGAPLLADILAAAPQVTLLVTSRERLKLRVEYVYALQGLAFSDWQSVEEAQQVPAVRLFVECARRVRPSFALREEDLEALRQIVQMVAGMPLALILATAWLELLSPSEIAAEIARSLDFLAADYLDLPARQRSMRAVFETTWARLEEREQELFAALSVFRGGFTLAAAHQVAGATPRDLRRLAHRSLLSQGEGGGFEVHELLRQFAAEELARSPAEVEAIRGRHSEYYLAFLEKRDPQLKGMGAEAALKALAADIDNIYAAWDWAVARQQFALLGAGAFSLAEFSRAAGCYGEGLTAFSQAIEPLRRRVSSLETADPADLSALVVLLIWQCRLQIPIGALDRAIALCNEALSLLERPELEETDTRRERALALVQVAPAYMHQDRSVEAEQLVNESIRLLHGAGASWEMATAFEWLGGIALRLANFEKAGGYFRQAMEMYRDIGDQRNQTKMLFWLGFALEPLGTWDEAERAMLEGIKAVRDLDQEFAAMQMTLLAEALIHRGKFEQGQAMTVESMELHKALGERLWFAQGVRMWCEATLHLGHYEDILDQMPMVLETSRANRILMSLGMSQFVLGCACLALGQLGKARDQLEEGTHILRQIASRDYLCLALPTLACAHVIAGHLAQARKAVLETTKTALDLGLSLYAAPGLAAAALLLRANGEVERAVELYALACSVPYVANSHWYYDVVGRELLAAAISLPPDVADSARMRGQKLDMWQTAAQLLVELEVAVASEE